MIACQMFGGKEKEVLPAALALEVFHNFTLLHDDVMDKAGLPLLGVVPEDFNVVLAASFGKPLLKFTKKGAAAACKRIARRMKGFSVPIKI